MRTDDLETFVGLLSLVYHEARNVRHLIKGGFRDKGPYEALQALPTNRQTAWTAIQELRERAVNSGSARVAASLFANRFRLRLEDLVDLYEDPGWRSSPLGGNKWAGITRSVIDLRDALDLGDLDRAADCLHSIPAMEHNTGLIGDKLDDLDAGLERRANE